MLFFSLFFLYSKKAPVVPKNDDKFDSPKRKANEASDSSDSSDSDSDSDSDSSDSDSSDSDSDAGAKKSAAAKPTDKLAPKVTILSFCLKY